MPTIDVDSSEASTGYTDFDIEHVALNHKYEPNNNGGQTGPRTLAHHEWDPLQSEGGLAGNEVAEVVAIYGYHNMEHDRDVNSLDQDQASQNEARGVVGANFSENFDKYGLSDNINPDVESRRAVTTQNAQDDPGGFDARGRTTTEDRIFTHFKMESGLPFQGSAGGNGGSVTNDRQEFQLNFREMFGRGPILDDDDTMSQNSALIIGQALDPVLCASRYTIVYDVAETDDAGREFALPA